MHNKNKCGRPFTYLRARASAARGKSPPARSALYNSLWCVHTQIEQAKAWNEAELPTAYICTSIHLYRYIRTNPHQPRDRPHDHHSGQRELAAEKHHEHEGDGEHEGIAPEYGCAEGEQPQAGGGVVLLYFCGGGGGGVYSLCGGNVYNVQVEVRRTSSRRA